MAKNDRANFGSKLGVILASAGSAVGLGNPWRRCFYIDLFRLHSSSGIAYYDCRVPDRTPFES